MSFVLLPNKQLSMTCTLREYIAEQHSRAAVHPGTFGTLFSEVFHGSCENVTKRALKNLRLCLARQLAGSGDEVSLRHQVLETLCEAREAVVRQPSSNLCLRIMNEVHLDSIDVVCGMPFAEAGIQRSFNDVHERAVKLKQTSDNVERSELLRCHVASLKIRKATAQADALYSMAESDPAVQTDYQKVLDANNVGNILLVLSLTLQTAGNTKDAKPLKRPDDWAAKVAQQLVEEYRSQSVSSTASSASHRDQGGIRRADAALVAQVELTPDDVVASGTLWCNALVEYESLPPKMSASKLAALGKGPVKPETLLRKRRSKIHDHYRTGLCQVLAYLTSAQDQCGAWLGVIFLGTRYSRVVVLGKATFVEILPSPQDFKFAEVDKGMASCSSIIAGLTVVTAGQQLDAAVAATKTAAEQTPTKAIPDRFIALRRKSLRDWVDRHSASPYQLAHDLVKDIASMETCLDFDALQTLQDVFAAAALDIADHPLGTPLEIRPPVAQEDFIRCLRDTNAFTLVPEPEIMTLFEYAGNDKVRDYVVSLRRAAETEAVENDNAAPTSPDNDENSPGPDRAGLKRRRDQRTSSPDVPNKTQRHPPSNNNGAEASSEVGSGGVEDTAADLDDDVYPKDSISECGEDLDCVKEILQLNPELTFVTSDEMDAIILARLQAAAAARERQVARVPAVTALPQTAHAASSGRSSSSHSRLTDSVSSLDSPDDDADAPSHHPDDFPPKCYSRSGSAMSTTSGISTFETGSLLEYSVH